MMSKSEHYLKEISKNTADIAKELKKMNRNTVSMDSKGIMTDSGLSKEAIEELKEVGRYESVADSFKYEDGDIKYK